MPYPTITMKVGDRGDHVKQLQAGLNRDYPAYSKLVVDGIFGPATDSCSASSSAAPGCRSPASPAPRR